jgi:lipoprotein-anchoring transpeptidase ErfK/SrfK
VLGAILNSPDDLGFSTKKPWLPITVGILVIVGVIIYIFGDNQQKPAGNQGLAEPQVVPTAVVAVATPAPANPALAQQAPAAAPELGGPLARARELDAQGKLMEARTEYLKWWHQSTNMKATPEVEGRLAEINMVLLMNCAPMVENLQYVIQNNDSISGIADRFGTTIDLTKKRNGLSDSKYIRAGGSLNVFTGRFSVVVSKTRNDMVVMMNNTFWKRYGVSTGKFGKTPVGTFKIASKDVNPAWYPGGKVVPFSGDPKGENILGTRWMSLKATGTTFDARGYGIHGTWDDNSIGTSASAGCVRMHNPDVEELFMLLPIGTTVSIED